MIRGLLALASNSYSIATAGLENLAIDVIIRSWSASILSLAHWGLVKLVAPLSLPPGCIFRHLNYLKVHSQMQNISFSLI